MNEWLAAAAAGAGRARELGCWCSVNDLPTARPGRWPTTRCSTSAATWSAGSSPRTSRTAGTPGCCSTRPPGRCSAATCSPGPARPGARPRRRSRSAPPSQAEDLFGATALTANTAPTLRTLADLEPRTLALMHGPAFVGDSAGALRDLADAYEARVTRAVAS